MNESGLWRWLSDRLPPGDYTRIESPCSPGVPDVTYTLELQISGWIELKIGAPGTYPFRGERHGLRRSQCLWLRRRIQLGVPCAIVAVIGPAFAIWRLTPDQVDPFNDLDRGALQKLAVWWLDRADVRHVPVKFLL